MGRVKDWLLFKDPGHYLNPLAQIFFIITLADGIAFTFFSTSGAVQALGIASTAIFSLTGFGVVLLVITAVNTMMLVAKNFKWGRTAAMMGFTAWFYVVVLYAMGGFWLAMIIHPLPQVASGLGTISQLRSTRMVDEKFEQQVEFLKSTFIGWLQNMQKDAYAQGGVIPAEVIAKAFKELREYYDILDKEFDLDEQYKKLLGEE